MSAAGFERECASVDADLACGDEEVRRLAVERLAELPDALALPRLLGALGDASWRARKAAVERLAMMRDAPVAIAGLIGALADGENSGRRNAAAEALVACGRRAVPALLDALSDEDGDVRKQVVDVLAGVADPASTTGLCAALRDRDPNVRAAAAEALGAIGGDGVASALAKVAQEDGADALVRISALRSLGRLDVAVDVEIAERLSADAMLRPAVFEALAASDDPRASELLFKGLTETGRTSRRSAVASLVSLLARADGAAGDALAARIRGVAQSEPSVVDGVAEDVAEGDLAQRMSAMQFLGVVGGERASLAILSASSDEALSEVAAGALAAQGDAVEEWIDAAWGELAGPVRRVACAVFAQTRGARGRLRLQRSLEDPDVGTQLAAIAALGASGSPDAVNALIRSLDLAHVSDDDAEERASAALDALARLASGGDDGVCSRIVDGIVARLEAADDRFRRASAELFGRIARAVDAVHVGRLARDPSPNVRRAAVGALARFASRDAREALRMALADEAAAVRCAAAGSLSAYDDDDVLADIERLAIDPDARVRAAAVRAIAGVGARREALRERALARVANALADEAAVAIAAGESLTSFGSGEDVAPLAASLLDHPVAEVVLAGIARIREFGENAEVDELIALVGHPDWTVRAEAIRALGERRRARSVPAILRRLETERDDFVRDTILDALRRLEG